MRGLLVTDSCKLPPLRLPPSAYAVEVSLSETAMWTLDTTLQFPRQGRSSASGCRGQRTRRCQPSWSCGVEPGEKLPVVLSCCPAARCLCLDPSLTGLHAHSRLQLPLWLHWRGKLSQKERGKAMDSVDSCMCTTSFLSCALVAVCKCKCLRPKPPRLVLFPARPFAG